MVKKDYFGFSLSDEELFFLVQSLKLRSFDGCDTKKYFEYDEDQLKILLQTSINSLLSKGTITKNDQDDNIEYNPIILAILLACVNPQLYACIIKSYSEKPEIKSFYYQNRKMFVIHNVSNENIHYFLAVDNLSKLLKLLIQEFENDNNLGINIHPIKIKITDYSTIKELIDNENEDLLIKKFLSLGIDQDSSTGISQIFLKPSISIFCSTINTIKDEVFGFTSYGTDYGKIALIPSTCEEEDSILLQNFDKNMIIRKIKNLWKEN
jgi:hypothetical protein